MNAPLRPNPTANDPVRDTVAPGDAPAAVRTVRRLALAGVLLACVVVILGAWTRLVDAGLGCPDWPGCYGFLLVPQTGSEVVAAEQLFPDAPVEIDKAWPEMIHRYFAGGLGLLVFGITVVAVRHRRALRTASGVGLGLVLGLAAMIITQAAFGAWTVTLKLWPQVVTAHLLGGFTTLSLLFLLWLRTRPSRPQVPGGLRGLMAAGLVLLVAQIALGGWTSSNYAALACPDFPTCQTQWVPTDMDFAAGFDLTQDVGPNYLGGLMEGPARTAIHWTHRMGAIVVTAVLGFLAFRLWQGGAARLAGLLGGVLTLQVLLGISNVVFSLPLTVATAHNAVGAALLLVLVLLNYAAASGPNQDGPRAAAATP